MPRRQRRGGLVARYREAFTGPCLFGEIPIFSEGVLLRQKPGIPGIEWIPPPLPASCQPTRAGKGGHGTVEGPLQRGERGRVPPRVAAHLRGDAHAVRAPQQRRTRAVLAALLARLRSPAQGGASDVTGQRLQLAFGEVPQRINLN